MSIVIVGAGSNLGARESAIVSAAALLHARPGVEVLDVSALYETPPLGPPQSDYLNAAFRVETDLTPPEILDALLRIERRLSRRRRADLRWGPRSIDLDLLWDSRGVFESPSLDVPHRELERRNFALGPLLDVAPSSASGTARHSPVREADRIVGKARRSFSNVPRRRRSREPWTRTRSSTRAPRAFALRRSACAPGPHGT